MIGTTLDQYKVTAALGEGGMGQVWRAEDEKLGREVALKVLPEEFAKDPERMARFEREAKVLASLNHPNIATLYGLESVETSGSGTGSGSGEDPSPEPQASSPVTFLAMELVEGEDLSERINRGALRPDGAVKVLDFGLAKAWESNHGDSSLSLSPTMTAHATQAGVILGTAAYMSPEQAAGVSADRRADIWAFGVVLWEMLTGHKLFEGETVSHVLAAVLKDEVDLEELPAETPARLRKLIARCLRKKPRERLQAIGDARIVLEEPLDHPEETHFAGAETTSVATAPPRWRRILPWAVAAVLAVAFAAAMWTVVGLEPQVIAATVAPTEGTDIHLNPTSPGPAAVSPD
ncbi:MAG: serine/threonine protein kinase, partial [Acidobacteria bacterium]|nr:serine/threonine protein kinase [Candidatus Sulfomarinibacter kjeldsenii]